MSEYIPKVGHVVLLPNGLIGRVVGFFSAASVSCIVRVKGYSADFEVATNEIAYIPRHAYPYSYGQDDVSSWEYQYYSPKHRHANA